MYWQAGRLDDAADNYRQALTLNRRTGWLEGQAINLGNLAAVSWQAHRDSLELALDAFGKAETR